MGSEEISLLITGGLIGCLLVAVLHLLVAQCPSLTTRLVLKTVAVGLSVLIAAMGLNLVYHHPMGFPFSFQLIVSFVAAIRIGGPR